MAAQKKLTPVQQAYERSKETRSLICQLGARSMECTEDKCGVVWERFIIGPNGQSVILYATPSWYDVFSSIAPDDPKIEGLHTVLRMIANGTAV